MSEQKTDDAQDKTVIPGRHGGTLTPFQPGQSGNPAGKPKGRRNLATIIRDMLEGELDFDALNLKDPSQAERLSKKYKGRQGWEAIIHVASARAIAGDTRAMQWLSKAGYGERLKIDPTPSADDDLDESDLDDIDAGIAALENMKAMRLAKKAERDAARNLAADNTQAVEDDTKPDSQSTA
jgi:hypothetical protein